MGQATQAQHDPAHRLTGRVSTLHVDWPIMAKSFLTLVMLGRGAVAHGTAQCPALLPGQWAIGLTYGISRLWELSFPIWY